MGADTSRRAKKKGRAAGGGRRRRAVPGRRRRILKIALLILGVLLVVAVAALGPPLWRISGGFTGRSEIQPSRVYGRPFRIAVGDEVSRWRIAQHLKGLAYRESPGGAAPRPGEYAIGEDRVVVVLRRYPTPQGWVPGGPLTVVVSGSRVSELLWRDRRLSDASFDPPLVAALYGPERVERRPVPVGELPDHLVRAILAAEDSGFFEHRGLSFSGIARAAWVNLRGLELTQGGSTLTQQLVKNLFLTHERTLARKLREVALAVILDVRFSKQEILDAYVNEIYWGSSGGASLLGVGAAAWVYFGKDARHVDLCEAAVLAGMIQSPGRLSPIDAPESSKSRRDWVYGRMVVEGWLDAERAEALAAEPLCAAPRPLPRRGAPYFVDRVREEARRRFGVTDLNDRGMVLLTTLDPADQARAEEAVAWGLEALEDGWEKGRETGGPLQSALVSLDPTTGGILAYVGGRDYSASQFDRVSKALRQAGSAFKPVVYAAALGRGVATPASILDDSPLTVRQPSGDWEPHNDDDEFRGPVTTRYALEKSLNVPTVRLAMVTGLRPIVQTARGLGIESRMSPVPALALGAFEVTPLELANVYATFAAEGLRPPVHAVQGVLDGDGSPIAGEGLPPREQALDPATTYLVTSLLQGVMQRGTGRSAAAQGVTDPLAGKTGTSNDRRDSWFGGYSPERATLVWVGYDDNQPTRLSGARGALPIWSRFVWNSRPPSGYSDFERPPGIATALIDPQTGGLATDDCPEIFTEVFREGLIADEVCPVHGGRFRRWFGRDREEPLMRDPEAEEERERGWLKRIFGRRRGNG